MRFIRLDCCTDKLLAAGIGMACLLLFAPGCSQIVTQDPNWHFEPLVGKCFELKGLALVNPTAAEDDRFLIWQCLCDMDEQLIREGARLVPSGSRFRVEELRTKPFDFGSDIAIYAVMLDPPYAGLRIRVATYIEEYKHSADGKPRSWLYIDSFCAPCATMPTDSNSTLVPETSTTRNAE